MNMTFAQSSKIQYPQEKAQAMSWIAQLISNSALRMLINSLQTFTTIQLARMEKSTKEQKEESCLVEMRGLVLYDIEAKSMSEELMPKHGGEEIPSLNAEAKPLEPIVSDSRTEVTEGLAENDLSSFDKELHKEKVADGVLEILLHEHYSFIQSTIYKPIMNKLLEPKLVKGALAEKDFEPKDEQMSGLVTHFISSIWYMQNLKGNGTCVPNVTHVQNQKLPVCRKIVRCWCKGLKASVQEYNIYIYHCDQFLSQPQAQAAMLVGEILWRLS
ncbi:hypothetical protein BKA93DRAFT_752302 [Sparassis latifolia]